MLLECASLPACQIRILAEGDYGLETEEEQQGDENQDPTTGTKHRATYTVAENNSEDKEL